MTLKITGLLLGLLILSGCLASHPLGIPPEDWEQMSVQERAEARAKQRHLDAERRRELAERAERERQQELEMAQRRADAAPGTLVQCTLTSSEIYRRGDWQGAQPSGIEVLRGETRDWVIQEQGRPSSRRAVNIYFDGINVRVCNTNGLNCDNLAASQRQLISGYTQTITINRQVRGSITCSLPHNPRLNHRRR